MVESAVIMCVKVCLKKPIIKHRYMTVELNLHSNASILALVYAHINCLIKAYTHTQAHKYFHCHCPLRPHRNHAHPAAQSES